VKRKRRVSSTAFRVFFASDEKGQFQRATMLPAGGIGAIDVPI
jgi:hypothetical protein